MAGVTSFGRTINGPSRGQRKAYRGMLFNAYELTINTELDRMEIQRRIDATHRTRYPNNDLNVAELTAAHEGELCLLKVDTQPHARGSKRPNLTTSFQQRGLTFLNGAGDSTETISQTLNQFAFGGFVVTHDNDGNNGRNNPNGFTTTIRGTVTTQLNSSGPGFNGDYVVWGLPEQVGAFQPTSSGGKTGSVGQLRGGLHPFGVPSGKILPALYPMREEANGASVTNQLAQILLGNTVLTRPGDKRRAGVEYGDTSAIYKVSGGPAHAAAEKLSLIHI